MYTASLKRSENYKAQPYQCASPSKQILKGKARPFPSCTPCGFNDHRPDDCRNYPECEICRSYDHFTSGHNRVTLVREGALAESSQSSESSIGVSGCSWSMTGAKSYLHKYVEQLGPKVVVGDNSSCITEGYGSINYDGIVFSKVAFVNSLKYNLISMSQLCDAKYIFQFDDKQGTIFNVNKEIVLIAPRRNDVYVLDMSLLTPNGACFFDKASESVHWLWHKRLSHLNFKNINKLAKQNKVLGLPSLVYSRDKPCSACEKGKHKRASIKTKQNFSIRKCLHLLYMDLFGPFSLMSVNHEKYTLIIVDEYSRYTWVYFLRKKSQAAEMIMSFNRMVESKMIISQNFSSPYTPKQNGVAERKNRTLIEAARTMLNGSVLSENFWRIACYTQNRSIIVKRHDRTPYEIYKERIPNIIYFHVFGCPVFIHNHKDHLEMTRNYFLQYTQLEILEFRDTLIQHMEYVKKLIDKRALHKREYDSWVNERQMQTTEENIDSSKALDASLVDTESSGIESKEQDTSSRSGNDAHADDADIRPIYDEEPTAEVQTTAEINVLATGQQHTEQLEFNNEGEVDENVEQCHDTCSLPTKLTDKQKTKLSYQSLESKNISLKKIVA
ncbi:retrovirus-related pol polyprotein from transposon TNT 1-94 [Tanacetum coccineum]|uniref:Retrovirus-related pol polyprotein from transposon TNT 1-94 n=1 Tax=Tanacetum coccineum TaxID=301880 RepID=A0ABQ5G7X1_9ASTR